MENLLWTVSNIFIIRDVNFRKILKNGHLQFSKKKKANIFAEKNINSTEFVW